jgi:hypothetical protein
MSIQNEELVKSLTSLIDETLDEIEEIKKSKFAAAEIKLDGPGEDGIAGVSANGKLDAKKKEEDEEDEEEVTKGENQKADQDAGKFAQAPTVAKGENQKADQDAGKFAQAPTVAKAEEDEEEDEEKEKKKKMQEMKKSIDESEKLIKSYVDSRFSSFEEQLSKMAKMIESISDAPVERRGIPSGVKALAKSNDDVEPLNKSQVADTLFELKKSGVRVDSSDIIMVETAKDYGTLQAIANKYGIK